MEKEAIDRVVARMIEVFGKEKTKEVLDQMRYEGAILSGSFVLQCIYGESWKGSDLDFYVPYKEDGKCCGINHGCQSEKVYVKGTEFDISDIAMLYNFHYYITRLEMVISEDFHPLSITTNTYGNLPIKSVRTFGHREYRTPYKVQVIQCEDPFMQVAEFDFDILKNVFGVNADGSYFLYIKSWTDIKERSTNFYYMGCADRTRMRAEKYIRRGISFRNQLERLPWNIPALSESAIYSTYREIKEAAEPTLASMASMMSMASIAKRLSSINQEYVEKYVNKTLDDGQIPLAAILTEQIRLTHVNDFVRYYNIWSRSRFDDDEESHGNHPIYTYFDNDGIKFRSKDIAKIKAAVLKLESKYLDLKYDLRSNVGRKFISWTPT